MWRWRDPDNFYVARAHALAGNVVAFKVVDGRRADLIPADPAGGPDAMRARVASGQWHLVRVDFRGAEFDVSFDGRRLSGVRDDALAPARDRLDRVERERPAVEHHAHSVHPFVTARTRAISAA